MKRNTPKTSPASSSGPSAASGPSALATRNAVALDATDLTPGGEVQCPNPKAGMQTWNGHPRVYLALQNGQARCPYCGAVYQLKTARAEQPA